MGKLVYSQGQPYYRKIGNQIFGDVLFKSNFNLANFIQWDPTPIYEMMDKMTNDVAILGN